MIPARLAACLSSKDLNKATLGAISVLGSALVLASNTWAASAKQTCQAGSTCQIGEYLYNDSYTPITNATCTLTSRSPDGTVLHNSVSMTAASDGWYSYSFTAPSTLGSYRAQVCCTAGTDYLCLDKSFDVRGETDLTKDKVSAAVWDAKRSTYNTSGSFGETIQSVLSGAPSASSVASAVWGYSGRTLTSFGTLADDVATKTNSGLLGLVGRIAAETKNQVLATLPKPAIVTFSETRQIPTMPSYTSPFVPDSTAPKAAPKPTSPASKNKPTIQNFLEEKKPNVRSMIDQEKSLVSSLQLRVSTIKQKVAEIDAHRGLPTAGGAVDNSIRDLVSLVGDKDKEGTLVAQAQALQDTPLLQPHLKNIAQQTENIAEAAKAIDSTFSSSAKISSNQTKSLAVQLAKLDLLIGKEKDKPSSKTLFGSLNKTAERAYALESKRAEVDDLLAYIGTTKPEEVATRTGSLKKEIASLNQIKTRVVLGAKTEAPSSPVTNRVRSVSSPQQLLKNQLLELRGLIDANNLLLLNGSTKPLVNIWLEEGSLVFRSLASNPSNDISQTVEVQYYLPEEIKESDVVSLDEGLEIKTESESGKLYVYGNILLAPGESKTLAVELRDIFSYSDEQISSLAKQAGELLKPLQNTSYWAQGVILQSDIEASLDKITEAQKRATTPDDKIKTFRESKIEYQKVLEKMEKFKDLVSQASSANALVGFVGGSQAIAVWGIIIIMVAGFVFLALYMRLLRRSEILSQPQLLVATEKDVEKIINKKKGKNEANGRAHLSFARFAALLLGVAALSALASGLVTYKVIALKQGVSPGQAVAVEQIASPPQNVLSAQAEASPALPAAASLPSATPDFDLLDEEEEIKGTESLAVMRSGESVEVFDKPKTGAKVLISFTGPEKVEKLGEIGKWALVRTQDRGEPTKSFIGWIKSEYLAEATGGLALENSTLESGSEVSLPVPQSSISLKNMITISQTSTGYLNVRDIPGGKEIGKAKPGEEYEVIGEDNGWLQIVWGKESGWIAKRFTAPKSLE